MKITIHVAPIGKPRMTNADKRIPRPATARYWAYKDEIALTLTLAEREALARTAGFDLLEFYIPMPNSWSNEKKLIYNNLPHQQTPDIDNLIKAFFDAVMIEDKQVWRIDKCRKYWSTNARIEVDIK